MEEKKLLEEFVKFAKDRSITDININDDTILYFLEEKGIIEVDFLCDRECSGEAKCGEQCQSCCNMENL